MNQNQTLILCAVFLALPNFFPVQADQTAASCITDKDFDLQGHRGARGLFPENTVPGFLYALDLGVTTLEMDVVINAQGSVVLSHEPWISATICSHPDGHDVSEKESKKLNIFQMTDEEVRGYDCGSRGHPVYPDQKAMKVSKPLLGEVFEAVQLRTAETGREAVLFNIEIKSSPEHDGLYHPQVESFARSLYDVLQRYDLVSRTSIQSFDPRALEATHDIDPEISLVLLVDNSKGIKKNLKRLSFTPDIYSPYYKHLDKKTLKVAKAKNIHVIPWTVNDQETMEKMIKMGVDGLITDYPDLALTVLCSIKQNP